MVKQIMANIEFTVNIRGIVYDVLLVPREKGLIDVDYTNCPDADPANEERGKE